MKEKQRRLSPCTKPHKTAIIPYRRCGASGLMLPAVSLGLWHNFGDTAPYENMRALCRTAFDHGITHFDLANNYGPEPGSAERKAKLLNALGLPPRLSKKELVEALNRLYSFEQLNEMQLKILED